MIEKRRSERIPITLHLNISDLYKEDNHFSGIHDLDSPIKILDISKIGFSFISECVLPTGYCFNADLGFKDFPSHLFTLVRIVRSDVIADNQYLYGCEFTNQLDSISALLDLAAH